MAEETSGATEQVEIIEVKGLRGSLRENINAKRFAANVSDVITSEYIGKFPIKTLLKLYLVSPVLR